MDRTDGSTLVGRDIKTDRKSQRERERKKEREKWRQRQDRWKYLCMSRDVDK